MLEIFRELVYCGLVGRKYSGVGFRRLGRLVWRVGGGLVRWVGVAGSLE